MLQSLLAAFRPEFQAQGIPIKLEDNAITT
jgi:hypothetical protein